MTSTAEYLAAYAPYPGFHDPDDWRTSVSYEGSDREVRKVQEWAYDATADHVAKHQRHDHPWCARCWRRFNAVFEGGPDAEIPDSILDPQARTTTLLRALRYLNLHGRRPVDEYVPDTEAGFDDEFLDRDELDDLPTPEPLITGIMPRHAYGILRGRDGTYKSFVALDWALCLATGKPWQGRHSERVRVLYIAGEGAYGLAARVDAWEAAWGYDVDPDALVVRKSALNLHKPGPAFEDLLERIEAGGFGLVVVDTLRRVAGGADGNGSDMAAVVDNLDRIKRATLDGTVLTIAHTDKSDTDSRGYSGIEDDADFVWHAKRDEQLLTIENTKMKDGPDGARIHLAATKTLDSLVLSTASGEDSGTTESQLRILDTMRSSFREGAYGGQLAEAAGLSKSTYYRALNELKDAGHLVNTGSKSRPFYELGPNGAVPSGPSEDTGPDLHVSHESHMVPTSPPGVPRVPHPLGVGLGTGNADGQPEPTISTTREVVHAPPHLQPS